MTLRTRPSFHSFAVPPLYPTVKLWNKAVKAFPVAVNGFRSSTMRMELECDEVD